MEMRSTKQRLESGARALALIDRRRAETGLRNIGCNVERMAVERELAERDIVSRSTGLWVVSTLEQTAVRSGVKLGLYLLGSRRLEATGMESWLAVLHCAFSIGGGGQPQEFGEQQGVNH
jgi:hypothetical protein